LQQNYCMISLIIYKFIRFTFFFWNTGIRVFIIMTAGVLEILLMESRYSPLYHWIPPNMFHHCLTAQISSFISALASKSMYFLFKLTRLCHDRQLLQAASIYKCARYIEWASGIIPLQTSNFWIKGGTKDSSVAGPMEWRWSQLAWVSLLVILVLLHAKEHEKYRILSNQ